MNSNWTGRCPRTSSEAFGCDGRAIEVYKTPLTKRFFYALIKHGWWVFALFLAHAGHFTDLTSSGGWRLELQAFFLVTALVVAFTNRLGPNKG